MTLSGCDFTLGPKVKTNYVIVHTGKPFLVVENVSVKTTLDKSGATDQNPTMQDIGGWYVMPPDHFHALAKAAGIE